ncbi:MAG: tripartite tricarboxylate transporter permease [Peptococcaceae bacterium]
MLETFSNLLYGFSVAITPINILYCLVGVISGTVIGALPGLGPSAGLAVLLPLTFGADPVSGIIMLAGIYYGAMYGGAITSILINTPGDSAAVMTTLDGYPLTIKGKAGPAMGMAAFSSFIGGTFGIIVFTFLAPALAKFALSFGPPEYFALMVLGLTTLAGMTGSNPTKGFISALIGLMLAVVGLDLVTGLPRYTFGRMELFSGIDFIPVAMGVFGIGEILVTAEEKFDIDALKKADLSFKRLFPSARDWARSKWVIIRGTVAGFFIGMLPGAGATIASFISYGMAKKSSKHPEEFGQGAIEGVAAPECANNAASVGAFVPLLTLGVPGSASTAILMGALMMFGLRPGPLLFERNPDFVWGLIGSMYVGNVILILMVMVFVPIFVRVLQVPRASLNAVVMAFILMGAYSLNNSMFDVYLTIGFGVLGYFMKKLNYPGAPLVLALVLGQLLENSLRQSLILSEGSVGIFFARPISALLMIVAIGAVFVPIFKGMIKKIKSNSISA